MIAGRQLAHFRVDEYKFKINGTQEKGVYLEKGERSFPTTFLILSNYTQ
jgi:hypothetical protein